MTRNNIKNYFVISVLILSALSMAQSNAFAASSPSLGTAGNFAVLGASTVTNTGLTTITGNLGVSPGTAITGFPPGTVTGTTYAGGSVAARAHADAATAYSTLSRATCTTNEPAVADIGGQTLKPGVYCFPSSAAITGTLTLSGSGVYIFKIGSTLVTAAGPGASKVVLTNGASANNVFWKVGSSATLGTGSVLKGTVIAYSSITSTTGATVDGRLLALNGAVTLDTNKITVPQISTKLASSIVQNNAFATSSPNIGTASTFAVLGASTVTNTGLTTITGNLGVSPGTAITGFPPGTVTGTTYAGGSVAARAHADAATAFSALSSAKCTTIEPFVADIGGQTLKPGVYCFPSSAAITGTLTLSGSGVYIFKIGSTLVTAAGPGASKVVLTGGADASNVFWWVGSSATLGTGSVLKGTVIAYSSITSTTGATVDGRLLALNGAVTLDTNKITVVPIYKK